MGVYALKRAGCLMVSTGRLLGGLLRLLGQQNSLDVGQNTTLSDRDARRTAACSVPRRCNPGVQFG